MLHARTKEPPVADLMTRDPVVIPLDATLAAAVETIASRPIRHLPVVDGKTVVGLVSQRDLLAVRDRHARACDFMSAPVVTITPDAPARDAAKLLLTLKIGCLPVVTRTGELVGIVTETDFVRVAYGVLAAVRPTPARRKHR